MPEFDQQPLPAAVVEVPAAAVEACAAIGNEDASADLVVAILEAGFQPLAAMREAILRLAA